MAAIVMGWGKCIIKVGKTGDKDAFSTALFDIGKVKEKTTVLEAEDGEERKAVASGGEIVAREYGEKIYKLKTRIIEPSPDIYKNLLGASASSGGDVTVKTTVADGDYSVQVEPQKAGAIGIKARKTNISVKDGYSEEEGNYMDLEISLLSCADGELYTRTKKVAAPGVGG